MAINSVVIPNESLGRYLCEKKGHFSIEKNSVLPRTFMPPADLRLSVFRIDNLRLEEIWAIGYKNVIEAMPQPKELYGLADIKVSKVRENSLEVDPDNNPPRHASIIGWPLDKERQKIIAQALAAEATLILK